MGKLDRSNAECIMRYLTNVTWVYDNIQKQWSRYAGIMYTIVYTQHIIYTTRYQVLTKYGAVYKSARAVPDSSTSTSSTVSETECL